MKDRTGFLRSPRFTAYVSRSPPSRAPNGGFAKRPFRFLKLQGCPAALTLTLSHPFSHLLLASHRRLHASPAASTAAPPWSPPPPAHHPLPRIYLPRRLSLLPLPRGSCSSALSTSERLLLPFGSGTLPRRWLSGAPSPSPWWFSPGSLHIGLRSGGRIRHSGRRREARRACVGGANAGGSTTATAAMEESGVRRGTRSGAALLHPPDPRSRRRLPPLCSLVAATRAPPDEREYARRVGTERTQVNGDSGHGGLLRAADPAGPSYASPTELPNNGRWQLENKSFLVSTQLSSSTCSAT
jgi:hypothetical protein